MKEKIIYVPVKCYVADDGEEFRNEYDCKLHEAELSGNCYYSIYEIKEDLPKGVRRIHNPRRITLYRSAPFIIKAVMKNKTNFMELRKKNPLIFETKEEAEQALDRYRNGNIN